VFLAERLLLVEGGRHRDAASRWADRALLPPAAEPSPETPLEPPTTREEAWSRQITTAVTALEAQKSGPGSIRAAERLAQSYDRAGWFREAKATLAAAERAGALSREGSDRLLVTDHLDRFAAALDSVPILMMDAPEATAAAAAIAHRHGFTAEGLRARGLYFGARPVPLDPERSAIELAVMVATAGPLTVRQLESTASVRRIVLDDNALREPAPTPMWASAGFCAIENGTVIAYHRRDWLRTAAVDLFRALEADGGKVSLAARAAPDTQLASELRLLAVLPMFDAARVDGAPRRAALRRFTLAYLEASMEQAEAEGVRRLLDERAQPGRSEGAESAARGLLAAMASAPHPRLVLARTMDVAWRIPGPAGEGARAALMTLESAMRAAEKLRSGGHPAPGDSAAARWTGLDDAELRALALTAFDDERLPP
jgi:hypothetical protein